MGKTDDIQNPANGGLTTVITDDLRMLLFWASIGVHLSRGGYFEQDTPHILERYAEHVKFTLPYEPRFAAERLPSFKGAGYVEPQRHEK
jgi:hypothetical protein